jgi:hypothetical protein
MPSNGRPLEEEEEEDIYYIPVDTPRLPGGRVC